MNDPYAALARGMRLRHKALHGGFRLVNRMSMQVALCLDCEVSAVQAVGQSMVDPRRHSLHVFVCALDRKWGAPLDKIT